MLSTHDLAYSFGGRGAEEAAFNKLLSIPVAVFKIKTHPMTLHAAYIIPSFPWERNCARNLGVGARWKPGRPTRMVLADWEPWRLPASLSLRFAERSRFIHCITACLAYYLIYSGLSGTGLS